MCRSDKLLGLRRQFLLVTVGARRAPITPGSNDVQQEVAVPRIPDVNRPTFAACERPDLVLQTGHTEGVAAVAFSPEDRCLASSSRDNTVKIWDLKKGFELRTLRGHTDSVNAVSFSPDGELLASGSADNTVKLWDVATGRQLFSMPTGQHIMGMIDVAFRPDGKTL